MSNNSQSSRSHSFQQRTTRSSPRLGAEWSRQYTGAEGLYINLEAKPGNGDKVEQFLRDILAGVEQEPGTGPWFGTRFSDTTFGIFEAFPDTAARHAHDVGPGGQNSLRSTELEEMLAYPAHVYRLDVMFGKFSTLFGKKIA